MKLLGEKIKRKRRSMKLSLDGLSSRIGCSKSYLWELEKNRSNPSASMIKRLSDELHVSADYLINDKIKEQSCGAVSKTLQVMISNLDSESLSLVERIITALQPTGNKS